MSGFRLELCAYTRTVVPCFPSRAPLPPPHLPSPPASRHAVQARQKRPVVESVAITTPTHVACRMPSHSWTWSDSDAYAYGTLGRARASAIGHPSGPTGKHHPNVSTVGRVAAAAPNCQCHHDLSDSTRARRAELGVYMGLSPHLRPVPLSAFVGLIALRMHVYCGIFVFMVLVVHHGPGGWRDASGRVPETPAHKQRGHSCPRVGASIAYVRPTHVQGHTCMAAQPQRPRARRAFGWG